MDMVYKAVAIIYINASFLGTKNNEWGKLNTVILYLFWQYCRDYEII